MKKTIITVLLFSAINVFSQSKEDKIKELIQITGGAKLAVQGASQYIEQAKKAYPNVPGEFWDEFSKEMSSEKFTSIYIPIYNKYYTETDIDELIKFYKTPVGKKTVENMPLILKESMEAGGKMGQEISEEIMKRIDDKKGYQNPPPPMPSSKK